MRPSNVEGEIREDRQVDSNQPVVHVLILLFLINLLNQIDRRGLVVIFPLLQSEWGLNDAQLGLAVSLFTLGRAAISLPAGWLADRIGSLRVLRPLVFGWSILSLLSGMAGSFLSFVGLRMAVGLADGANGPLDLAYLGQISPPKRRGLFLAIYSVAIYAGSALGIVFAGAVGERFGWRWVLIIPALLGLLAAIGLLLLAPKISDPPLKVPLKEVKIRDWRLPGILPGIFLAGACGVFASTGLVSWLPSYLIRQYGMGLAEAGFLTGGLILPASILGALTGGWLSDRLVKKRSAARAWVAVVGLFLAMVFGLAGLWLPLLNSSLFFFFLASFCFTIPVSPLLVIVQESLADNQQASGQAMFGLVTQVLGAAPATVVVGWLSDRVGLPLAMVVPVLMAGVGALIITVARVRQQVTKV